MKAPPLYSPRSGHGTRIELRKWESISDRCQEGVRRLSKTITIIGNSCCDMGRNFMLPWVSVLCLFFWKPLTSFNFKDRNFQNLKKPFELVFFCKIPYLLAKSNLKLHYVRKFKTLHKRIAGKICKYLENVLLLDLVTFLTAILLLCAEAEKRCSDWEVTKLSDWGGQPLASSRYLYLASMLLLIPSVLLASCQSVLSNETWPLDRQTMCHISIKWRTFSLNLHYKKHGLRCMAKRIWSEAWSYIY